MTGTVVPFKGRDEDKSASPAPPVITPTEVMPAEVVPAGGAVVKPGAARAWLERTSTVPSPARLVPDLRWWCTEGLVRAFWLAVKSPFLLLAELRPTLIGAGKLLSALANFMNAADHATRLDESEDAHQRFADRLERMRTGRRIVVAVLLVALVIGGAMAYAKDPLYLVLAGGLLALICDAVGHHVAPPSEKTPPPHRAILREGVPLSQVTAELVKFAFESENIELGVAKRMWFDPQRQQYEIWVTALKPIEQNHLRQFERAIGAVEYSMRSLAPPDGESTTRRLVIKAGDPLSLDNITPPPPVIRNSESMEELTDLGHSMTETPFALPLAGQHAVIMAGTGGGKTAWLLRNLLWALCRKRDVRIIGIDLSQGPELALWQRILFRKAFDPETADAVLDEVIAEIERRARILSALAEDDDPTNDNLTEWSTTLGPYWEVISDEYPVLAKFNGTGRGKYKEFDLVSKIEHIYRVGRKHGVSVKIFIQKSGNDDTASSVPTSQANILIAGPCSARDAVDFFGKDLRDQGFQPHLLKSGTKDNPFDAGKCFVLSPMHKTPDVYRTHMPPSAGDVKRLCRRLAADGFVPASQEQGTNAVDLDAVEVPEILAAVEKIFLALKEPIRISTTDLLEHLADEGHDELDERKLAELLRPVGLKPNARWRPTQGDNPVRGYLWEDVQTTLRGLAP